ncbi:MAG: hypothetical protein L0228_08075 [Planctomycetes bacterium]|nr:hypothetical protein [Planctomycetota bacterium]
MTDYRPVDGHKATVHQNANTPPAQAFTLPIVDQCCRRMEFAVKALIEEAKAEATWTESYAEATELLESVPLSSGAFELARQRLRNALDYCCEGEFGAACFELRRLRNQLAAL